MEKAYDPKALLEKMRAKGGPDAEKLAKSNYLAFKEWLQESAALSDPAWDDIAVPGGLMAIDPIIMKALNAIDGVA